MVIQRIGAARVEVSVPQERRKMLRDLPSFGLVMLTMSSVFLRQVRQQTTFSFGCSTEFAFGNVNGLAFRYKEARRKRESHPGGQGAVMPLQRCDVRAEWLPNSWRCALPLGPRVEVSRVGTDVTPAQ
jgi:hypothetical protein